MTAELAPHRPGHAEAQRVGAGQYEAEHSQAENLA